MRVVYYVPSHLNVDDYKNEWYGRANEIHTTLSESIKDYITKGEEYAQWVRIPEYTIGLAPEKSPHNKAISFKLIDEFYLDDLEKQYTLKIWDYDLETNKDPVLFKTVKMEYDRGEERFYTKHIQLPVGWYKIEWYRNDELIDDRPISVYEEHDDHEIPVSDGAM